MFNYKIILTMIVALSMILFSCGGGDSGDAKKKSGSSDKTSMSKTSTKKMDPMNNKGIGPVDNVTLGSKIDYEMAKKGKEIYEAKCASCHKPHKKYIGPPQAGVLNRRTPEWIMNMILNPEEMVQKDPIAKDLMREYSAPMANQNITREQARQILEYFRTLEEK